MQAVQDTIQSAVAAVSSTASSLSSKAADVLSSSPLTKGPIGTLYTPAKKSFKTRRCLAVAAFAGLEIEVNEDFKMGETNKTEEYLAKFPTGKVPAFENKAGFSVVESIAISYYFASLAPTSTLIPLSATDAALVQQWISIAELEIGERLNVANGMFNNFIPFVKPVYQNRIEKALGAIAVVENHLETRTFLVNERITLADITLASVLADGYSRFLGPEEQKKFPNTFRFYQTVINNPSIASVFADAPVAKEAAVYTPPKKEKDAAPKKEAAPAAPKAPKAAAAPKAKEADEEEEESFADEPKEKNPLDALPKSTFNLEEWKRQYSNLDTRKEAIPWFYENFDKSGFSIHKITFKYNEELTLTFMSSNQIGGFFNRLEASRKYLFGSVGVLGKSNDSIITGVLILRGLDAAPVISVAPDWESYKIEAIDLEKKEDKEFFEGSLAWDLTVDGKEWADGKNFK